MYKGNTILAVVPARGGSSAVPRKNIALLAGKPLIHHTMEQIRGVSELDMAVVSTDNDEIATVAAGGGAEIIIRPAELAKATSKTEEALFHVLDVLEKQRNKHFDYVCVLEPTSPFRSAATISKCIKALIDNGAESLMTVTETRANIGHLEDGFFRPLRPDAARRRQDREPFYIESSTVYLCRTDYLRKTGTLVSEQWLAVEVPAGEAVDINEPIDFAIAETIAMTQGAET